MDYKAKLREQLGFLGRSCALYDELGYVDEAIRMAVCLRVIFHQTNNSTSLVRHLDDPTLFFDTWPEQSLDETTYFYGLGIMDIQHGVASKLSPMLDFHPPIFVKVDFDTWWNQTVWKLGDDSLSRKQLVLYAANKDGGAHVADKLPKSYQKYKGNEGVLPFTLGTIGRDEQITYSFDEAHYVGLRQISFEVLSCAELLKMAEGADA